MKISLLEFIHRLVFLVVSIFWTVMFFWLLEDFAGMTNKTLVFIVGVLGFIFLGRYDIKYFKGRWF